MAKRVRKPLSYNSEISREYSNEKVSHSALHKKFSPKKDGEGRKREREKQGVTYDQRLENFPGNELSKNI